LVIPKAIVLPWGKTKQKKVRYDQKGRSRQTTNGHGAKGNSGSIRA